MPPFNKEGREEFRREFHSSLFKPLLPSLIRSASGFPKWPPSEKRGLLNGIVMMAAPAIERISSCEESQGQTDHRFINRRKRRLIDFSPIHCVNHGSARLQFLFRFASSFIFTLFYRKGPQWVSLPLSLEDYIRDAVKCVDL